MKKITGIILVASLALTGCARSAWVDGKKYSSYGLFNEGTRKNPKVAYETSIGNVVWSIILIETIVFPVYFIGFSLFNPVGPRTDDSQNGVIQG